MFLKKVNFLSNKISILAKSLKTQKTIPFSPVPKLREEVKNLFCSFFKNKKVLEGKRENGLKIKPKRFALKINNSINEQNHTII